MSAFDPRPAGPAPVFAALGDRTRLALLSMLCDGRPRSIAALAGATRLTRQAVTKHLDVLAAAHLVERRPVGRESHVVATPAPIGEASAYLDTVSAHWTAALDRLRALVEDPQ